MMTDQEKIEWMDSLIEWMLQWDSAEEMQESADNCADAPYDLFNDVVELYAKVKND